MLSVLEYARKCASSTSSRAWSVFTKKSTSLIFALSTVNYISQVRDVSNAIMSSNHSLSAVLTGREFGPSRALLK